MDAETAVSSGWLTSLAVMKVGLRVVKIWMVALKDVLKVAKILTGSKMIVSSDWLTNLGSLKVGRMVGPRAVLRYLAN